MKSLFLFTLLGIASLCHGYSSFMGFTINGTSLIHREPPVPARKSFKYATEQYITQKLDNFNDADTRTWSMRYISNDEHFQSGGPIFIFVGGEWEISDGWVLGGHLYDMAEKTNGYLFYTEHRYYGKSLPTDNASTENLQYLTVEQALADLKHFVEQMKRDISGLENSKVIVAGGSYSATMVTLFRQMYPETVDGAWASSAPLFAKANFYEYKETVGDSISILTGSNCYNTIKQAYDEINRLYESNQYSVIENKFDLCYPINIQRNEDEWYLFDSLASPFSGLIQYHSGNQMQDVCNIILSESQPIDGLAKYLKSSNCMYIDWNNFIRYFQGEEWGQGATSGGRQWMYQTCRQFGWFQSLESKNQPFGQRSSHQLYLNACGEIFGNDFMPQDVYNNIDYTNAVHGGLDPQVTNVYFTHGQLDPWRRMGIEQDYNPDAPADVIPLASHVADMNSISSYDSPEMRAVKERVYQLVLKWIGN